MLGNPIDASGGKPPKIKIRTSAEDNSNINSDFSKQSVMKAWGTIKNSQGYQNFLQLGPDTWQEGEITGISPSQVKRNISNQVLDMQYDKNYKITKNRQVADFVAANVMKDFNAQVRTEKKKGNKDALYIGEEYYNAKKNLKAKLKKKGK
jgi:hypothetical protein